MESRLTYIADTRNRDVPFRIGVWSQGVVTWRRLEFSACARGQNFETTCGLFLTGSNMESKDVLV